MKMNIKKSRLNEIIQQEYARHERMRLREGGELGHTPSRREHLGDAVADVLDVALKDFLAAYNLDPGTLNNIMLDVEEPLLDAAIAVSHALGTHARFPGHEMTEGEIDEETLSQAIAEVLAEEGLGDGDRLGGNYTTGYGGSSGESPDQTVIPGGKK